MSTELVPVAEAQFVPATATADVQPIDLIEMAVSGLLPQSQAGYRKDFAAFGEYVAADAGVAIRELVRKVDQGAVNAILASWVAAMVAAGRSPATIRRRIAAIARVFKVARRYGLTTTIPEVELPRAEAYRDTEGPGKRNWEKMLAAAQAEALALKPMAVRDVAILLLLHDRALRRGELVSADLPDDFDSSKPAIQVRRKGKTQKIWLTISTRAAAAVSRWIDIRGSEPGPLFTRVDPGCRGLERLSGQGVNEVVKRIARGAKIARTVRAHGLRHQATTEALDAGWDVRDVKELTGHAKIDTVLIYDDRRKDVGGQISRDLAGESRGRKPRRKTPGN